ncbi:MAG TPA: hypothetical protein VMS71_00025 [Candidatus Acidoferrum sp.]|nr:hypothetical protein [Candidatus Acidoferrum sp.]
MKKSPLLVILVLALALAIIGNGTVFAGDKDSAKDGKAACTMNKDCAGKACKDKAECAKKCGADKSKCTAECKAACKAKGADGKCCADKAKCANTSGGKCKPEDCKKAATQPAPSN